MTDGDETGIAQLYSDSPQKTYTEIVDELHAYQRQQDILNGKLKKAYLDLEELQSQYRELYDFAPIGYLTLTTSARIVEVNLTGAEILGKPPFYLIHKRFGDFIVPQYLDRWNGLLIRILESSEKQGDSIPLLTKYGTVITTWVEGVQIDTDDKKTQIKLSISNITDYAGIQETLQKSESQIQKKITSTLTLAGDITGLNLANIIEVPKVQQLMNDFYRLTKIGVGILDENGTVLISTGWQDICTRFHRAHPVTNRNCIESDIFLSKELPQGTSKQYRCKNNMWDIATPIIVGNTRLGTLFLGQFLYDDEELDYAYFRAQALKNGFDEKEYIAALERVPRWSRETINCAMDFYTRFVHVLSAVGWSNICLARTVSERDNLLLSARENEEKIKIALQKFQTLFESFPLGISITNKDGQIIEVNAESERLLGISREEIQKYQYDSLPIVFINPDGTDMHSLEYAGTQALYEKHLVKNVEMGFMQKSGEIRWLNTSAAPIPLENYGVVISYGDITQRKMVEEALRKALSNRDVLLSEVHHRVKNNLASIIALISLQQKATPLQSSDIVLADLKGRIKSMALVHDMLCQSDTLELIDYDKYLNALLPHLITTNPRDCTVSLTMNAAGVEMNIDTAVPCSMIVHELVTNALKYAFPNDIPGDGTGICRVLVDVTKEGEHYKLIVQDNGIGLPPKHEKDQGYSLGLRLVRMLAEHQLGGNVTYHSADGGGTVCTVQFKE